MPKQEVPLSTLAEYLPENTTLEILQILQHFKVHLTITRQRKTVLGDYRNAHQGKAHRISVNGNLNKYSFLITLLHELAHLLTFEKYRHTVQPHGREWKSMFSDLLSGFMNKNIFPPDVDAALRKSLTNPSASSCGDLNLMRTLQKYDPQKTGHCTIEQLSPNSIFSIKDGRQFQRGEKIRTRYRCMELGTNKIYLFSAIYEVKAQPQ
jgi:SprT protein